MINEALAVRREEQKRRRSDRAAAEVTETESSAPAVSGPRENPIEPGPNPKRRLIMKSASTTASGSGQERERRAIPDDDSRMQIEDKPEVDNEQRAEPPGAPSKSIRRRIAVKSEPRAVTTEAVDGYREKAMRMESVEQIELGNIMELSITGQVLRWARQSNLSGGVSLRKADGWNMKNHSHLTVARHLRDKIHPIVLVVTISEGEEKGICSAVMRELPRIVKDQIGEECADVMVLEQQVYNLEKSDCENLAEEKTDETHRR